METRYCIEYLACDSNTLVWVKKCAFLSTTKGITDILNKFFNNDETKKLLRIYKEI